jgi:hypothetical protein
MNKVNNTHSGFMLILFLYIVLCGCDNTRTKTDILNPAAVGQDPINMTASNSIKPDTEQGEYFIEFTDSIHFQKVKQYIEKNGKHDRVSISSVPGDTSMMVDYYSIISEGWKITKDHHTRIYFSYESYSYGNVFLVHDSVHVEPYYIGPRENIDTLNEIRRPIVKLYNSLVNEVLKE